MRKMLPAVVTTLLATSSSTSRSNSASNSASNSTVELAWLQSPAAAAEATNKYIYWLAPAGAGGRSFEYVGW